MAHNETPMKGLVMNDAKRFYNSLKQKAIENPLLALAIGAAVVTATTKLVEANTQRTYAKAHAKEIDRRIAKTALR